MLMDIGTEIQLELKTKEKATLGQWNEGGSWKIVEPEELEKGVEDHAGPNGKRRSKESPAGCARSVKD
jgi:hypothetical protein